MTYTDQTPKESRVMQKLQNFKTNHLLALSEQLAKNYPCMKSNTEIMRDADFYCSQLLHIPDAIIRQRMIDRWTDDQIEKAHYEVVQRYRNGERYYKKGRSFGARNKRNFSSDTEAVDALQELESFDEKPENNTYEEQMDTSSAEPIKAQAPQVPQLNEQLIREAIARSMRDFILAYGRDKEALHKDISENFMTAQIELLKVVEEKIANIKPNIIEIKRTDLPELKLGVQHKNFEKLLKVCSARMRNGSHNNVWIYGPAGTGKSTAAEKVAEALSLDYYTDGKMADETKVTGYKDANGTYHSTNFRKAFENGGVYLADEIDGSMPDALLALNGALANGHCSFPDRIVARHPDFIFLAAANTTGTGGTIEYVGRFKQDAAFNDRFVFLDWPLDEALEDSLVSNKTWLETVRYVRRKIATSTIKGHLITPRASIYGESLLAAGLSLEDVSNMVLKKGLTEAQWNMVNHNGKSRAERRTESV